MLDAGAQRRIRQEQEGVLHQLERRVDVRGQSGLDQRAVQARRAAGRAVAAGRCSGQRDGERGERRGARVGRARRAEREHDDRQRATCAVHGDASLAVLLRLGCFRRLAEIARRLERAEGFGGMFDETLGFVVAGHDDVRVVRRVEAPVVRVEAVARHELDLVLAPDDALAIGVTAERDGLQLLTEQERRVVLVALALAHDHRSLGLGLLDRDERVAHAIGLELERGLVTRLRDRLEVAGHVLAGEGVPLRAVPREEPVEVTLGMFRRSFEEHVLEEVRHPRGAGDLVASADVIPDPQRHDRRVPRFERVQHQPVVEATRRRGVSDGRDGSILDGACAVCRKAHVSLRRAPAGARRVARGTRADSGRGKRVPRATRSGRTERDNERDPSSPSRRRDW